MIPGSAGIRMHLAQGAARADFLLRRRSKKFFEVSPAGARFSLLGQLGKAKICLAPFKVSLENCRLRARPSSARMHLAQPSQRADPGIASCRPMRFENAARSSEAAESDEAGYCASGTVAAVTAA